MNISSRSKIPSVRVEIEYCASGGCAGRQAVWCRSQNPARWLDIINSLHTDFKCIRILPIHGEGALIHHTSKSISHHDSDCLKYVWTLECLWIPVHSRLSNPLTQSEIEKFFPSGSYIYHPKSGFWEFDNDSIHEVTDLYSLPDIVINREKWSGTLDGLSSPGLSPVFEANPVSTDEWVQLIQDQIRSGDLHTILTGLEQEATKTSDNLIGQFRKEILRKSSSLFLKTKIGKESHSHSSESPRRAARVSASSAAPQGNGDLDRLLRLFELDPDKALEFSPRIADESNSRGPHPGPITPINRRKVEFNLRDFRKTSPSQTWYVPDSYRRRLKHHYIELAQKLVSLGAFEKAAYIHGYLLGDFHAAAGILRQGGFFQEAAAIYCEKLNKKTMAAACLADGQFHHKAADLYTQSGDYINASIQYRKAGEVDAACSSIHLAIKNTKSRIERARLYHESLGQPDMAIAELSDGWPSGPEAKICQLEHFRLLEISEKESAIEAFLSRLLDPHNRISPVYLQIDNLVEMVKISRNPHQQARISDIALILAGRTLSETEDSRIRKHIFMRIPRIRPDDPILKRDVQRFSEKPVIKDNRPSGPNPVHTGTLLPAGFLQFDKSVFWKKLHFGSGCFMAVGEGNMTPGGGRSGILAVQKRMDGLHIDSFHTPIKPDHFEILRFSEDLVYIWGSPQYSGSPEKPESGIRNRGDLFIFDRLKIHHVNGLPEVYHAIGSTDDELIPVIQQGKADNEATLQLYDSHGTLRHTSILDGIDTSRKSSIILALQRCRNACFIAIPHAVIRLHDNGSADVIESNVRLKNYTIPPGDLACERILTLGEEGTITLHDWETGESRNIHDRVKSDSKITDIALTAKGHPVILEANRILVFQSRKPFQKLYEIKLFPGRKTPISLGRTGDHSQNSLTVLFTDGYAQVYDVP